jgi:ribosomal protein S18 acetylase RimI-like enzyme
MTDVRIRSAVEKDWPFIEALVPELLAFGPPAWRDRRQMIGTDTLVIGDALAGRSEGAKVLIAEDAAGAPLGFMHLTGDRDYYLQDTCGHIADIVVAPEARGRGVGRALLAEAERWSRDRGYRLLTLNVFVENRGPQALYEAAGFHAEAIKYVKVLV